MTLQDGSGPRHTLVGDAVDMGGVQSVLLDPAEVRSPATSTLVMSYSRRVREVAALRAAGASRAQVSWRALWELALVGACLAVAMVVGQLAVRQLLGQGDVAVLTVRQ